jgi:hypothetical protein
MNACSAPPAHLSQAFAERAGTLAPTTFGSAGSSVCDFF